MDGSCSKFSGPEWHSSCTDHPGFSKQISRRWCPLGTGVIGRAFQPTIFREMFFLWEGLRCCLPYLVLRGTPGALTTLGSLRTLAEGVVHWAQGPSEFSHPYLRCFFFFLGEIERIFSLPSPERYSWGTDHPRFS